MLQLNRPGGRTNVVPAMQSRTGRDANLRFTRRTSRVCRFSLEQRIATPPRAANVGLILDIRA